MLAPSDRRLTAFGPRQRSQSPERAGDALRPPRRQRRRARGAGRRQPAARGRARNGRQGARIGVGLDEGPADESRADAVDDPRRIAGGFRRRTDAAPVAGAADGGGFRAPSHAGRARAGLARALRRFRLQARRRRVARPGASGHKPGRRAARLQAAISRHGLGGGDRPLATSTSCSRSAAAPARRSIPARSRARSGSGCARSSIISARPRSPGSIASCSPTGRSCACRGSRRACRRGDC